MFPFSRNKKAEEKNKENEPYSLYDFIKMLREKSKRVQHEKKLGDKSLEEAHPKDKIEYEKKLKETFQEDNFTAVLAKYPVDELLKYYAPQEIFDKYEKDLKQEFKTMTINLTDFLKNYTIEELLKYYNPKDIFDKAITVQEVQYAEKLEYKPKIEDLFDYPESEKHKQITEKNDEALIYIIDKYFNPKIYKGHEKQLVDLLKLALNSRYPYEKPRLAQLLWSYKLQSFPMDQLTLCAKNTTHPDTIKLLHKAGVDFQEKLGKEKIQYELSQFVFFLTRGPVSFERLNTIHALLDCGVKISEEEMPELKEWKKLGIEPERYQALFRRISPVDNKYNPQVEQKASKPRL